MATPAYNSRGTEAHVEGNTVLTIPANVPTGCMLLVPLRWNTDEDPLSITWKGSENIPAVHSARVFVASRCWGLFALKVASPGSGDIVVTFANSQSVIWGVPVYYDNPNASTLFENAVQTGGAPANPALDVASLIGDLVIGAYMDTGGSGTPTLTPNGETTQRGSTYTQFNGETLIIMDGPGNDDEITLGGTTSPTNGFGFIAASFKTSVTTSTTQEGYRWRNDDGDEDGATWAEAQDTDHTVDLDEITRLRIITDFNPA